jgi:hypothetical protein
VCRPEEALDCFLRTDMDGLVLNSYVVERDRADLSRPDEAADRSVASATP